MNPKRRKQVRKIKMIIEKPCLEKKRAFLYNDFKNNQSGKPLNLSTWGKILNEPSKRIIILKDQYEKGILGTK